MVVVEIGGGGSKLVSVYTQGRVNKSLSLYIYTHTYICDSQEVGLEIGGGYGPCAMRSNVSVVKLYRKV